MNKTVLYLGVSLLALTAGADASWWRLNHQPEQSSSANAGTSVPGLWQTSFNDVEGKRQPMAQWYGKPLVVNFWATWCGPCREEMPDFEAASKTLNDKAHIIGIAVDNPTDVKKFMKELGIDYPVVVGEEDAMNLMRAEGNSIGALPYTVVYDAKGKKVASHAGRLSREQLDGFLKPLM